MSAVTEHTLVVPPELAPGLALLAVEVRAADGLLSPRTEQGARLGTTYLAPVRVLTPAPELTQPAVQRLDRGLDVLEASVTQDSDALLVHVTWRPSEPMGDDLGASVRLLDSSGHLVRGATLDVQPRYGLYPTSLWPIGVPVADYYRLRVPRGTPPGSGYQVEIGLYQIPTFKGLGNVRIPGVTVGEPTVDPDAPVLQEFGGLALSSWELERGQVLDGEEVAAQVQWTARTAGLPDAAWRLTLLDSSGRQVAVRERPLSSDYPPSRWPLHTVVNGRVYLRVLPGTPPGRPLAAGRRSAGRGSRAQHGAAQLRPPRRRRLWRADGPARLRPRAQRQANRHHAALESHRNARGELQDLPAPLRPGQRTDYRSVRCLPSGRLFYLALGTRRGRQRPPRARHGRRTARPLSTRRRLVRPHGRLLLQDIDW